MTDTPASLPVHGVADAVERVAASVAGLRLRRWGTASAFCWRPGVLVTAASAVGHASRVQLVLPGGEAVGADVRGADAATDLAVLAADVQLAPVERRLHPAARTGDFVFAAGRDASGNVHASYGFVGATGGAWRTWRGGSIDAFVRLDGGLYAGLMGGPVADAQGRVVGLGSGALSRHHGVVLPAATLDRVADALLAHGRVARGHLGIAAQAVTLTPAMREAAGIDTDSGLLLSGVGEDSPAACAGLMVGDIVVAAGGRAVPHIDALRDVLGSQQVGAQLPLVVLRGGRREELAVEVGERRASRC